MSSEFTIAGKSVYDVHAFTFEDGLCWTQWQVTSYGQYRRLRDDYFKEAIHLDNAIVIISWTEELEFMTPEQIVVAIANHLNHPSRVKMIGYTG